MPRKGTGRSVKNDVQPDKDGYYSIAEKKPRAFDTVTIVDYDGRESNGWWTGNGWHLNKKGLGFLKGWRPLIKKRTYRGWSAFDPDVG